MAFWIGAGVDSSSSHTVPKGGDAKQGLDTHGSQQSPQVAQQHALAICWVGLQKVWGIAQLE